MKKLVSEEEEQKLVDIMVSYAEAHHFTANNILDAVGKVMEHMMNNACLEADPLQEEPTTKD